MGGQIHQKKPGRRKASDPFRYVIAALFAFVFIEAVLIGLKIWLPVDQPISESNKDAILVGWSINLIYVVITIVIYMVQRSEALESQPFNKLVQYLFGFYDSNISESVKAAKSIEIRKLGAYCEDVNVELTISDYCMETDTFNIEVRDNRTIRNLFKDISFLNEQFELSVEPDIVDKEILGEVATLEIKHENVPLKRYVESKHLIRSSDKEKIFNKVFKVEIDPSSTSEFNFVYSIRQLSGGPFWYSGKFYTPNAIISVRNLTDRDITVSLDSHGPADTPVRISPHPDHLSAVYSGPLAASQKKFMTIGRC